ncbi:Triacylglycerol lipase precursor [Actinokineospora spheciospongiae]|uniref:Triacylglycerol lipase n=1 Tax=Actinokineospora spheciospongiae TaxID=909613 RepID=W7IVP9_9PSEU|nr:Triacylglycerol lipase precursor [Actinokineospora spheciospongiae]
MQLDSYLNDTGRKDLADAKQNACVVELLANYPFKTIAGYTTTNPLTDPTWQARLAQNKLGQNPPRVPVFQYHASTDEIVNTPRATRCTSPTAPPGSPNSGTPTSPTT